MGPTRPKGEERTLPRTPLGDAHGEEPARRVGRLREVRPSPPVNAVRRDDGNICQERAGAVGRGSLGKVARPRNLGECEPQAGEGDDRDSDRGEETRDRQVDCIDPGRAEVEERTGIFFHSRPRPKKQEEKIRELERKCDHSEYLISVHEDKLSKVRLSKKSITQG